jgi:hypothetical protein
MRSNEIAKVLKESYPVDVWLEDEDWKTMKTLSKAIDERPSGDTLFDFIVKEIGYERDKKEIIRFLQKAITDIETLITGFKKVGKK